MIKIGDNLINFLNHKFRLFALDSIENLKNKIKFRRILFKLILIKFRFYRILNLLKP